MAVVKCSSESCERCVNGRRKLIVRRALRRTKRRDIQLSQNGSA